MKGKAMKIALKKDLTPAVHIVVNGRSEIQHNKNNQLILNALQSANGKASGHTFEYVHQLLKLAEIAERRLEALRLPKKYRAGARFVAVSGEAVPNKYKYTRIATMVKLERGPKCWFLIAAERAEIHQSGGWRRLHITKEQDKAAVELMRVEYDVI
jgi:hypothetical protein